MDNLSLNYTAIGSIPFKDANAPEFSTDYIFENFSDIPFWPQLPHFKKSEDMVVQYTQNLAGLCFEDEKYFFDEESDEFFVSLEELFVDYETVINCDTCLENEDTLDKYAITEPHSSAIGPFLKKLKHHTNAKFIKGAITGPFTFSTSLNDKYGKCAYYSETLREVVVKTLSLKALWQIKEFNKACSNAKPIIFIDEPSISQVGSCAFLTVKNEDVVNMLKEISDNIKKFGALSGIHCCGKTDWQMPIDANVNIINFDAYFYAQSIATYAKEIEQFLKNGNYLAFGIIPTLDKDALKTMDETSAMDKFNEALAYLTNKGIDEKLIIKQSFITPSCGCGSLNNEETMKALSLTKNLSLALKNKYGVN